MKPEERREFGELLMGLLELYGRQVTPSAAGLWWGAFEPLPAGRGPHGLLALHPRPRAGSLSAHAGSGDRLPAAVTRRPRRA
ncbi:MAG: hypothetical protein MZV65_31945 [Chromatiales bacterium]|nr:hypothetical protein [Chromatiales bacterium]